MTVNTPINPELLGVFLFMHYAFVSFGNNDIAMLQWALNNNIQVTAIYAETGWASESWAQRVADCTKWCEDRGIPVHTTSPRIGMGEYIIENGDDPKDITNWTWQSRS